MKLTGHLPSIRRATRLPQKGGVMRGEAPIVHAAPSSMGDQDEQVAMVIRLGFQYARQCLEVWRALFTRPREADRTSRLKGSHDRAAPTGTAI